MPGEGWGTQMAHFGIAVRLGLFVESKQQRVDGMAPGEVVEVAVISLCF
jgi:hypothetical protein